MRALKTFVLAVMATAVAMTASTALAQTTCGAQGTTGAVSLGNYDPFSPTGVTLPTVNLTLTRVNPPTGKTQEIAFYLRSNVAGIHATVIDSSDVDSGGGDVVFGPGETTPTPSLSSPPLGTVNVNFGGEPATFDTEVLTLSFTVDPGTDLSASPNITLDIVGICKGTGGLNNAPFSIPNAITFQLNVLSALQAYYSGTDLDFGEIGELSTAGLAGDPRNATGNINVRSSGPYSVTIASDSQYTLTPNNNNTATPTERITYSATFMGEVLDGADVFTPQRVCPRAGVPVPGRNIPLRVDLTEGGVGKAPADYLDVITVTIAPLAYLTTGNTTGCPPTP